ncbi:MAG: amidase [Alphaproteobacteria bacterium]
MVVLTDYSRFDAMGLAELVRSRQVTPTELLDAAFTRMEAVDPHINAVVMRHLDEACAALARGLPTGPFTGVPFLLKNLGVGFEGTVTDNGCAFFKDAVAPADTTLTARYRKAGFVICGKTNTPEFGLTVSTEPRLHGPTRNPWNRGLSAGGSSGGAAAAVAAGIVPAAHASDGGGSIRLPAAACGLFGFKPTRGRVPFGPDKGEGWDGMSHMHVVSRSVRDSAAILDATAGAEAGDPYAAPPGGPFLSSLRRDPASLRVALVLDEPDGVRMDRPVRGAVEAVAELLQDLGHRVEPVSLPIDYPTLRRAQATIIFASTAAIIAERAAVLGRDPGPEDLEPGTHGIVQAGQSFTARDYAAATMTMHRIGRSMGRLHETYDVILQPTTATLPPPIGRLTLMRTDTQAYAADLFAYAPFLALYNMTGAPSMSMPLVWTEAGLPVGVMFSADFGADDLLFALAAQLERSMPWGHRFPAPV